MGRFETHHAFLITEHLRQLDYLDEAIERVGDEIAQRYEPDQEAVDLVDTLPGVSLRAAQALVAEPGTDLAAFPSARHLASWAGICPGHKERGGHRLSGKTRKGNPHVRQTLIEVAHVASKTKDTYLAAQYRRSAAHRGKKRAVVAVAHSILVIIYHVLARRQPYQKLGGDYFDQLDQQRVQKHLVRRLERLGFTVKRAPNAPQPQLAA